jgi:alkylresorcinol/alkylpyrone synthase
MSALSHHPSIVAAGTALPRHRYDQDQLADLALRVLPDLERRPGTLARFFRRVGVRERFLALPAEAYARLDGLESRNRAWLEVSMGLAEQATSRALERAGLQASEVGALISTTVTGLAVPSLEARLMNRMPFPATATRMPLFGLGCLGGAAALARAADHLRAHPEGAALVLAVELCSLTVQRNDRSVANIISTGLFGDGAAAVVLVGARHRLADRWPKVVDSASALFPDTERVMGWDVVDTGFKVVLDPAVPEVVERELPPVVDGFLAQHGLTRRDIRAWIAHPGGPAVIDAVQRGLDLPSEALAASRRSLAEVGNLSSASVLLLLEERLRRPPQPGSHGLLMAMGPAFCAEAVLLRW